MTAVEWFAKQVLRSRQLGFISNEKFNELLEQAKEMEMEQKIEFAKNCLQENDCFFDIEQYYKETFKSE